MSSYVITYAVASDTWHLSYRPEDDFPGMGSEEGFSNGELVPDGPWTAFVSPLAVAPNGAIGLVLELQSGELLYFVAHLQPPPDTEAVRFVQFPGRNVTLRVEYDEGILRYSWSEDQTEWTEVTSFSPAFPVSEVGVVLRYDNADSAASGMASQARLLPGIWENVAEEVFLGEPEAAPARREAPPEVTVMSTSEPLVHVVVGAQFGDLEFDVGKSVRWVTWFCDNVFVLDVNLGTPRYWIVNWAETFPDAKHTVTGINYFVRPTEFRAEQWAQYKLAFGEPHDDDWILWLDASEGLNIDNRSLPDDYAFEPFKSFLWREIQRAVDLGQPYAVLPYYVFLRSDHIVNVTYETVGVGAGVDQDLGPLQAISTPYYQAYQGLKRLWKASELKKANFDWSQLDNVVAPSAGAKTALVSYAYAHWNLQDIEPPQTTVPELDANNDDGYRMRQLMSRVRPVPGIPVSDTWIPPSSDPAGLPGPWSPADANNPDPIVNSGPYLNPTVGQATIPDPGELPTAFTVLVRARFSDTSGFPSAAAQAEGNDPRSWYLYRTPTNGRWYFESTADGIWANRRGNFTTANQAIPPIGRDHLAAVTVETNSAGRHYMTPWVYNELTGAWTAGTRTDNGTSLTPFDVTTLLRAGTAYPAGSRVYSIEMRTDLSPAVGGDTLWTPGYIDFPPTATVNAATVNGVGVLPADASGSMRVECERAATDGYIHAPIGGRYFLLYLPYTDGGTYFYFYDTTPTPVGAAATLADMTAAGVPATGRWQFKVSWTAATDTLALHARDPALGRSLMNDTGWVLVKQLVHAGKQMRTTTEWQQLHSYDSSWRGNGKIWRAVMEINGVVKVDFDFRYLTSDPGTTITLPTGQTCTFTKSGTPPMVGTPVKHGRVWKFDAANPTGWTVDPAAIVANTVDTMPQPVTPDPSLLGLVTPLYDNAFRINMRDGVWYEEGLSGNIPLKWDEERQDWTTDYDPAEWAGHGVKSYDPTAVP